MCSLRDLSTSRFPAARLAFPILVAISGPICRQVDLGTCRLEGSGEVAASSPDRLLFPAPAADEDIAGMGGPPVVPEASQRNQCPDPLRLSVIADGDPSPPTRQEGRPGGPLRLPLHLLSRPRRGSHAQGRSLPLTRPSRDAGNGGRESRQARRGAGPLPASPLAGCGKKSRPGSCRSDPGGASPDLLRGVPGPGL